MQSLCSKDQESRNVLIIRENKLQTNCHVMYDQWPGSRGRNHVGKTNLIVQCFCYLKVFASRKLQELLK